VCGDHGRGGQLLAVFGEGADVRKHNKPTAIRGFSGQLPRCHFFRWHGVAGEFCWLPGSSFPWPVAAAVARRQTLLCFCLSAACLARLSLVLWRGSRRRRRPFPFVPCWSQDRLPSAEKRATFKIAFILTFPPPLMNKSMVFSWNRIDCRSCRRGCCRCCSGPS